MSSSLAAVTQGIAIPPDEIRSALDSMAYPGFTGMLQVQLYLLDEASKFVRVAVWRAENKRTEKLQAERQVLPDPERKKPVQNVIDDIKGLLYVRTVLVALEVHYLNGVVKEWKKLS
jgi:hypothetical protein